MKKIYTAVETPLVENLLTMLQGDHKVKDEFWQLDWPFVFWWANQNHLVSVDQKFTELCSLFPKEDNSSHTLCILIYSGILHCHSDYKTRNVSINHLEMNTPDSADQGVYSLL